jgi:hypothetical protein
MPRSWRQFNGEPRPRDVLADPIVLAVMAGDGTSKGEVDTLIGTVQRRLANAQAALREKPPPRRHDRGDS